MNLATREDIEKSFTNHTPDTRQISNIEFTRQGAKAMANLILARCPSSRERSLALTHLETALMYATKSIIVNPEQEQA